MPPEWVNELLKHDFVSSKSLIRMGFPHIYFN